MTAARALALGAGVLAALAGGARADEADDVDACATASEKGQELRDQGKLRAARDLFVQCAAARCPPLVQKDCAPWLAQVDERLPTVAIRARDGDGHDVDDVRVSVDGAVVVERLDGRAIAVDPGTRTFTFSKQGAPEVKQTLLLREGEKGRLVDVVLGAPRAADVPVGPPRTFSVPPAALALGGVSIAAFGGVVGFGLSAKTAVDDMRAPGGCAPSCDPARVDGARRDMILTNVLIGVGAAAMAAAAVVVVVQVTAKPGAPSTALRVGAGAPGISLTGEF